MPMWDKIMLRKRYIIECMNELLKNNANFVHLRHRSIHNFIMNSFFCPYGILLFGDKPKGLFVYVDKSSQFELFEYYNYPELAY